SPRDIAWVLPEAALISQCRVVVLRSDTPRLFLEPVSRACRAELVCSLTETLEQRGAALFNGSRSRPIFRTVPLIETLNSYLLIRGTNIKLLTIRGSKNKIRHLIVTLSLI